MNIKIIITENCNFNCDYCFYHQIRKSQRAYINFEVLESFIQYISYSTHIESLTLTGGEPLIYKDFSLICASLKKYTSKLVILTNGSLISEKNLNIFNEYIDEVEISIDDISIESKSFRGHIQETYAGLKLLKEKTNITLGISMSIHKYNYKDIPKMIDFCKNNNIRISFNLIENNELNSSDYMFSSEQLNELNELLKENSAIPQINRKLINFMMKNKHKKLPCKFCKHNMIISPRGEIGECYNNYNNYGNIFNDNYEEIMERYISSNKEKYKYCKDYTKNCYAVII